MIVVGAVPVYLQEPERVSFGMLSLLVVVVVFVVVVEISIERM
jgi:hypothetical protein